MGFNYAKEAARAHRRADAAAAEAGAKRRWGPNAYLTLPGALHRGDLLPRDNGRHSPVVDVTIAASAVRVATEDGATVWYDPAIPVAVIGPT